MSRYARWSRNERSERNRIAVTALVGGPVFLVLLPLLVAGIAADAVHPPSALEALIARGRGGAANAACGPRRPGAQLPAIRATTTR